MHVDKNRADSAGCFAEVGGLERLMSNSELKAELKKLEADILECSNRAQRFRLVADFASKNLNHAHFAVEPVDHLTKIQFGKIEQQIGEKTAGFIECIALEFARSRLAHRLVWCLSEPGIEDETFCEIGNFSEWGSNDFTDVKQLIKDSTCSPYRDECDQMETFDWIRKCTVKKSLRTLTFRQRSPTNELGLTQSEAELLPLAIRAIAYMFFQVANELTGKDTYILTYMGLHSLELMAFLEGVSMHNGNAASAARPTMRADATPGFIKAGAIEADGARRMARDSSREARAKAVCDLSEKHGVSERHVRDCFIKIGWFGREQRRTEP